jgi:hypothetical protein
VPVRPASILLLGVLWVALAAGCVTRAVLRPDALVRPSNAPGHRYEIQLVRDVVSHGNLHDLDPVTRQEYASARWLYVDSLVGELPADQIILASFRHDSRFFRAQQSLEGVVRFTPDGRLQIALRVPRYGRDASITRQVDFEFNGTYRLVPTTQPAPPDDIPISLPKAPSRATLRSGSNNCPYVSG